MRRWAMTLIAGSGLLLATSCFSTVSGTGAVSGSGAGGTVVSGTGTSTGGSFGGGVKY